jgi:hypothetical protein
MHVPMMFIRIVRVPVPQWPVRMLMRVRLGPGILRTMLVPMMLIVNVPVIVD